MTQPAVQSAKRLVWTFWQHLNEATARRPSDIHTFVSPDVRLHAPHPINELNGVDAWLQSFWYPLSRAFPDLHRRTHIFFGGTYEDGIWVGGRGDLIGTFALPFLNIPATGTSCRIAFGEYCRVEDNRIVESILILDLVSLMRQAGLNPLPPNTGRDIWIPGPMAGNGVLHDRQDDTQSQQTLDLIEGMLFKGMQYNRNEQDRSASRSGMAGYWQPDMVWHGPAGIGSAYGLEEFKSNAQGPILAGFPDRTGGFHQARFAEGHVAGHVGLSALRGTHSGDFLGIPPTQRRTEWRIMDFYLVKDGLLHEDWVMIDLPHVCHQLGLDLFANPNGHTRN